MINALFENRYGSGLLNALGDFSATKFAEEIAKRAGKALGISADATALASGDDTAASEKSGQLENLREALTDTLSWVGSRYGNEAAQTVMGVMEASLGKGDVTEDSLSQALLKAVRFVDGAFSFEEGDAFMEHLNGSLNESLNALFDNGANELFFAVNSDGSLSGIPGGTGDGNGTGFDIETALEGMTNAILELLEEARAQAKNAANGITYGEEPQNPTGIRLDTLV